MMSAITGLLTHPVEIMGAVAAISIAALIGWLIYIKWKREKAMRDSIDSGIKQDQMESKKNDELNSKLSAAKTALDRWFKDQEGK